MSVAVLVQWDADAGVSEQDYWSVTEKLGTRDALPDGCLRHHVAYAPDTGLMVLEEWTSGEAFGRFAEEQLGPVTAELGVSPPTRVVVAPTIRSATAA